MLLQVIDEGRLTDGKGRIVNFKKHNHYTHFKHRFSIYRKDGVYWFF